MLSGSSLRPSPHSASAPQLCLPGDFNRPSVVLHLITTSSPWALTSCHCCPPLSSQNQLITNPSPLATPPGVEQGVGAHCSSFSAHHFSWLCWIGAYKGRHASMQWAYQTKLVSMATTFPPLLVLLFFFFFMAAEHIMHLQSLILSWVQCEGKHLIFFLFVCFCFSFCSLCLTLDALHMNNITSIKTYICSGDCKGCFFFFFLTKRRSDRDSEMLLLDLSGTHLHTTVIFLFIFPSHLTLFLETLSSLGGVLALLAVWRWVI